MTRRVREQNRPQLRHIAHRSPPGRRERCVCAQAVVPQIGHSLSVFSIGLSSRNGFAPGRSHGFLAEGPLVFMTHMQGVLQHIPPGASGREKVHSHAPVHAPQFEKWLCG
jgi:hypothetical protein